LAGHGNADLVIVAMGIFTLAPVPAQGVSGGKALFYAHFKHAASVSLPFGFYCNARANPQPASPTSFKVCCCSQEIGSCHSDAKRKNPYCADNLGVVL